MKILLSLVLSLVCGTVYSQEPPKPKPEAAKSSARASQRGTDKAPVFVKGEITTNKSEAEAKEDAEGRKQKLAIDRTLVEYTGFAAVFAGLAFLAASIQIGFFWWQLRLMRKGVDDAYQVAESAKTSADLALKEFNATHVPKLQVRRVRIPDPQTTGEKYGIEFVLANVGSGTATNITGNINITVIPANEQQNFESQAFPLYGNEIEDIGSQVTSKRPDGRSDLKPRERIAIFIVRDHMLRFKWTEISKGQELVYFFGYITFHDTDGVARDTGFFRTYYGKHGKWQAKEDDPDYEWS